MIWYLPHRFVINPIKPDRLRRVYDAYKASTSTSTSTMRRLEPGTVFKSIGVDFFGPMLVKERRNKFKVYGCLFVICLFA